MIIDAQLIAEALLDIRPFDKGGEMTKKINDMMQIVEDAEAAGTGPVDRTSLAIVITGEPQACEVMAQAYTKALHGHGLIAGKSLSDPPALEKIDWPGDFEDSFISRQLQEYNHAYKTINEAKDRAAGGTLVIPGIHKMPYVGYVDEEDAGPKALNGALRAITSFMAEGAGKERTPVVILTGEAEPMAAFLAQQPEMQKLFEGKTLAVCTEDPAYSTELNDRITVRGPLKLKLRSPSFS
ncbi:MAG: hypothetical protein EPN97_02375 [Alphaproteobacteria bacterium]|nr:MAG: hypothetical protein EPN97_02375 [Alphaproteobacteria bacterium]